MMMMMKLLLLLNYDVHSEMRKREKAEEKSTRVKEEKTAPAKQDMLVHLNKAQKKMNAKKTEKTMRKK